MTSAGYPLHILNNDHNVGFGAAINQAAAASSGQYVATLNDDCIPSPEWLQELVTVADREYEIGLCAAQVRLAGTGMIDSAGMLIARDGASKQKGFGQAPTLSKRIRKSFSRAAVPPCIAAKCWRTSAVSTKASFCIVRTPTWASRALGGVASLLCSEGARDASLLAFGRKKLRVEGVPGRAQSHDHSVEEFPVPGFGL